MIFAIYLKRDSAKIAGQWMLIKKETRHGTLFDAMDA
jgi:hypothetical protein